MGRWVDIGGGVEEFVAGNLADDETSDRKATRQSIRRKPHAPIIRKTSPERPPLGLLSPPPSERKRVLPVSSRRLRVSHLTYDWKLKVSDTKGRKMPRLVFRWWDAESKGHNGPDCLRAGLYTKESIHIPPPFSGPKLKTAFLDHLTPKKRLSPFISTFENFLPALNRALKSKRDAYISLIDLQQAEKDSRKRFPHVTEVVWPIKVVVQQYGFQLKNNYRGHEWLIHGIIESGAIIKTIKVSDIVDFAHSGQIPHMRDVLTYIGCQQHAFGILDNLHVKLPKTSRETGTLVGKVLRHLAIPDEKKALVARKVMRMMKFRYMNSLPRQRAYVRGVYDVHNEGTDSESDDFDEMDRFVVSSEEDDESTSSLKENDEDKERPELEHTQAIIGKSVFTEIESDTSSATSSAASQELDEQRLLDAQLHATTKEWLEAPRTMLRISHVEVPKFSADILEQFIPISEQKVRDLIDLTRNGDEEDNVIEVEAASSKVVCTLPIRSASITAGPRGIGRLEMDARLEVMEVMQFE